MLKENARTLHQYFKDTFSESFTDVNPPGWSMKDMVLLKKIIDEQSYLVSKKLIKFVIRNWHKSVKKRFRLAGYPTIGLIWAYRFSLLDFQHSSRPNSVVYEPTKKEHKKDSVKKSDKELFLSR